MHTTSLLALLVTLTLTSRILAVESDAIPFVPECDMSPSHTHLQDGHILHSYCPYYTPRQPIRWAVTTLDLNTCIGNMGGQMSARSAGYMGSCVACELDYAQVAQGELGMECYCETVDQSLEVARLELGPVVVDVAGTLRCA